MELLNRHPEPMSDQVKLIPASQFTIEDLTNAYNQTRVDYMVPMPMNAARLASYVNTYNVDMDRSWVAIDQETDEILGLAMLGVRAGRTWITRLGVLPVRRRRGTGRHVRPVQPRALGCACHLRQPVGLEPALLRRADERGHDLPGHPCGHARGVRAEHVRAVRHRPVRAAGLRRAVRGDQRLRLRGLRPLRGPGRGRRRTGP